LVVDLRGTDLQNVLLSLRKEKSLVSWSMTDPLQVYKIFLY